MDDDSFWAGYCDGYRNDSYHDSGYDKSSYKEGYRVGKQESSAIVTSDLEAASFIEEYE